MLTREGNVFYFFANLSLTPCPLTNLKIIPTLCSVTITAIGMFLQTPIKSLIDFPATKHRPVTRCLAESLCSNPSFRPSHLPAAFAHNVLRITQSVLSMRQLVRQRQQSRRNHRKLTVPRYQQNVIHTWNNTFPLLFMPVQKYQGHWEAEALLWTEAQYTKSKATTDWTVG